MNSRELKRMASPFASILIILSLMGQVVAAGTQESANRTVYRLASGDRVQVTVYGHNDISGEYEIDGEGEISMPLVGAIDAAGLTLTELQAAITDEYRPDYLKNPRVNVEVLNYKPFYIFGEVNNPGQYEYSRGLTVINAIALAGGYTHRAKKSEIRIERSIGDEQVEIKATPSTVILPGDVIEIPERFF